MMREITKAEKNELCQNNQWQRFRVCRSVTRQEKKMIKMTFLPFIKRKPIKLTKMASTEYRTRDILVFSITSTY